MVMKFGNFLFVDDVVLQYNLSSHSAIGKPPFEAFRRRSYSRLILPEIEEESGEGSDLEREAMNIEGFYSGEENMGSAEEEARESSEDDRETFAYTSRYNEKMNTYKQVHLQKKKLLVGDMVLVKMEFDNNTATRKGKFDGFYRVFPNTSQGLVLDFF
jgi:hypothetical protein